MKSSSMRRGDAPLKRLRRLDWSGLATWALAFSLVAYLGLKGGGFDPLVHDQVALAAWWVTLAGVAVGALPRSRLGRLDWAALALLGALVCWTALSLLWTESVGNTSGEVARVAGYLGILWLAMLVRGGDGARRIVAGVGAAIALVAFVALLSRLHPSWFPEAGETVLFISDSRERLSYPLNYWNGLAALIAIGAPLMLQLATGARTVVVRSLAAAALPALALTAFFTLSRGGIAAAFLALAIYLALSVDRLPRALTLLLGGAGGAALVFAAASRDALQEGLRGPIAQQQGDEMLLLTIVVCALVGLAQAVLSIALLRDLRPRWTTVSRSQAQIGLIAGVVALLLAGVALDARGRAADGWDEFREGGAPGSGTERLGSVAGQSRYDFWKSAVDENATRPLSGTGAGTFEFWWARNATTQESVRDAHSLYLQVLGELGLVGFALLLGLMLAVVLGGAWVALGAGARERAVLAAAVAGCAAFWLTAGVDWMWQIPVLPVAMFLLAGAVLGEGGAREEGSSLGRLPRVVTCLVALAAIVAIAIPLTSASLLRESESDARQGDMLAALEHARDAQGVQQGAAAPRLQQALVLEQLRALAAASDAARAAVEREETNWRNWLVLARIEAQRGRAAVAVRTYRRARSLNPRSPVFDR